MAFPRSADSEGFTPEVGVDKEWKIPLPGRQRVIGLVIFNTTDVPIWIREKDQPETQACLVPNGQVRRMEFDREPEWQMLEGIINCKVAVGNSGTVHVEVE